MSIFSGVKSLFTIFTNLPLKPDDNTLNEAAVYMPLAPLIGAVIGLISAIAFGIFRLFFPAIVAGVIGLGVILLITGLHHTDGLIDFGDGLAASGTQDEKIGVMNDASKGVGGFILALVVLTTTSLSMSNLGANRFVQDIIVAEVTAKLAMVNLAWIGRPALQTPSISFIEKMRGKKRRLRMLASLLISLLVVVLVSGLAGAFILLLGILSSIFVAWISARHFGGVTGDVFGASNDIGRMVALLGILSITR